MSTVLIVDDDAALRKALATALSDLGHEPAETADGAAALAWLVRRRADAVLLDLRMPGMDGIEVLRRIRAQADPPPVAVLTAVPTSANTIEAMRLGAADHLAKPIGREDLKALLARMLSAAAPAPLSPVADDEFIGSSTAMREVQKTIGLLADSDSTVLISARPAPARRSSRARSIATVAAPKRPSLQSIALPSLASSLRACCLAMSAVPSPTVQGRSKKPLAGRCSSTRSATWTRRCRPSCYVYCRSGS